MRDKFPRDARRLLDALFRHDPFGSRRDAFNVWGLCPPASESGISRPSTGVQRDTPAKTTYDAFGSERYVLTFDNRALRDLAQWSPYEFVEILVNAGTYGGGGIRATSPRLPSTATGPTTCSSTSSAITSPGSRTSTTPPPCETLPVQNVVEPWEPNVTALLDPAAAQVARSASRDTKLPTPWLKEEFEKRQRDFQARRRQIRADNRPEAEMSALFREELGDDQAAWLDARRAVVGAYQGANYERRRSTARNSIA